MTMHFRALADRVAADGRIDADEILALRRAGWADGHMVPEEVEAIFAINDRLQAASVEWSDFMVEAVGEFLVNGTEPRGYVSPEQADWLIARIDHDGRLDSMTELELLVKVLEKATDVPPRLKDYALAQIERAVMTGTGPTRDGCLLSATCITGAEARLLRRMLFSQAGDKPAAIGKAEAELLFRLKDATLGHANAPEWERLFVQGVGNYLMGFSGYAALPRKRAAELERFMDDRSHGVGRFFGRMARADVETGLQTGVRNAMGKVFGRKGTGQSHAAHVAKACDVTTDEDIWLRGRMDDDDRIDPLEQALLDFIAEEQAEAARRG